MGQRLDSDPGSVTHDLHGPWRDPQFITKSFGNHHSTGTVNGCFHA